MPHLVIGPRYEVLTSASRHPTIQPTLFHTAAARGDDCRAREDTILRRIRLSTTPPGNAIDPQTPRQNHAGSPRLPKSADRPRRQTSLQFRFARTEIASRASGCGLL